YRENELPERFDRIVQSWDTANKATELSDFSVCTTWGVSGNNLLLLGVFRRRLEYPVLKRAVREQQNRFVGSVILIEDKASGTRLIQELIVDGCPSGESRGETATSLSSTSRRPRLTATKKGRRRRRPRLGSRDSARV